MSGRHHRSPVIRGKLTPPPRPSPFVPRPRLAQLVRDLLARHRVLFASATAGAGKTTAIAEVARYSPATTAWLTLDETDAAPGRLLIYLEAALASIRPHVQGMATEALGLSIPHAEVAGLLAEAAGDEPGILVIDELDRVAGAHQALALLESLIRYAAPSMRFVLLSRAQAAIEVSAGVTAAIGDDDLAFTTSETAKALAGLGMSDVAVEHVVEVTRGWVTGVLFEAWKAEDHAAGRSGGADPLHGYLATHILASLSAEERDLLITTSVLDRVNSSRAEALGVQAAGKRLSALRTRHLPVIWDKSERTMRCHPCFREFLLEQLDQREGAEVTQLRLAHGHLLAEEGLEEEATEEFLRVGALAEARETAGQAVEGVVERLDFPVVRRWLNALSGEGADGASPLTTAELMVAIGQENYRSGARVADQLAATGAQEPLARRSPRAAAAMAWCYFHVGRLTDALAVLDLASPGPEVDAARYLLALAAPGGGVAPPPLTGNSFDALIMRVHSIRGHFDELAEPPASWWARVISTPWHISALRATGHPEEALTRVTASRDTDSSAVSLHALVRVEILIDLGRRRDAVTALRDGRELIRRSGSVPFELQSHVLEAKLALRLNGETARARATLERLDRQPRLEDYRYIRELADTWHGLALLRSGEDALGLERLARAVRSMCDADRILELPEAAVFLAEAAWRAGDEETADGAADVALDAAQRQGSNHILLQALAEFPAVASRRIDAEASADSPWHDIGRALRVQGVARVVGAKLLVEVQEFGHIQVRVDGQEVRPRLSKSLELLVFLAQQGGAATRDQLLDALFDGRADRSARSYLRQAVHMLREVLPVTAGVSSDGRDVCMSGITGIVTQSHRFEQELAAAARLQGNERLAATLNAVAPAEQGEYLPGLSSAWVDARREQLVALIANAQFEAAQLALTSGRYEEAEQLISRVLTADALREGGWRLAMRIAAALGDDDEILRAYQRCERALATIGTSPTASTQRLLDQLRR
ncbi:MAG: hypothetical protein JO153_21155 [Solirubrobacterales bacterium]|nr:hypothetical protein [Solirubrobacterales bacterium]